MKIFKKGQGLSLNVIIIAALALIVLVVLAAIFIQQTGLFTTRLSQVGNTELASLKGTYGECHPGPSEESRFLAAFNRATTPEDQAAVRDLFRETIRACSELDSSATCEVSSGCDWQ